MGTLLPNFRKAILEDVLTAMSSNTGYYYAFASNPVPYVGNTPVLTTDNYEINFKSDWRILFGKKVTASDVVPVIRNIIWTTNTVYTRYDNTVDLSNSDFYVIVTPSPGGPYNIYKCIDNANGAPSTQAPDQVQTGSFTKSDGYTWRYIATITSANYSKFATQAYVPIYSNSSIVSSAYTYSGVETTVIANSGSGYSSYHDGTIRGLTNSTLVQIESSASVDNDFYTNNGIYLYNNATSQLRNVAKYVSNSAGNWVFLDAPANVSIITPSVTKYKISPKVVFDTDGDSNPLAYSTINTTANSISSIVIVDPGYGVTWANCTIVSNSSYGTGASIRPIAPPPGGHGYNPIVELYVQGLTFSMKFSNSEANTIPTNVSYNKIGILKNIPSLNSNGISTGSTFTNTTFSAVLEANVSPSATYAVGTEVYGVTSGCRGTVAFSNSTYISLTGDKLFSNGETITANGVSTTLNIITRGQVYSRDMYPLYVQNVDNVTRTPSQTESFKLTVNLLKQ